MANVYKSVSYSEKENRTTRSLTTQEKEQVSQILGKFKTYFTAKHL